jgi:hypothetical protein
MNKYYQILSYKSIPRLPLRIPDAAKLKLLTNYASGEPVPPPIPEEKRIIIRKSIVNVVLLKCCSESSLAGEWWDASCALY